MAVIQNEETICRGQYMQNTHKIHTQKYNLIFMYVV